MMQTLMSFATPPRDVYTTTSGGSWVNVLNWDLGTPDNDQTDGNDDIIITHHITLTDDLTVKSGTNITITACDTLHVTGNVAFNNGSAILVEPCGVLIIDGNLANNNNSTDIQINGKLIIGGDYDGGTGSELVGVGEMEIDGTVTTDGGSTVFGSGEDCTVDCDNSDANPLGDPLPIELLKFEARLHNGLVLIEWSTATEINNERFIIEKTHDAVNFEFVGEMVGAGNSNSKLNYNLIDYNPYIGDSYYRLTQVDYDGKGETFDLSKVYIHLDVYKDMSVYPNPTHVNEEIHLKFSGVYGEEVLVVVMDIHGRTHYTKVIITKTSGETIHSIDPHDRISSGTYMVVGSTNDELYFKTIIIE